MKALTLWQPWAWAICHLKKDVENRAWRPPDNLIGKRLAIHAGKRLDEQAASDIRVMVRASSMLGLPDVPHEFTHGAIVATVRLAGFFDPENEPVGWHNKGSYGWFLDELIVLPEPVPCRGAQGLWNVPQDVLDKIRDQLAYLDECREEP